MFFDVPDVLVIHRKGNYTFTDPILVNTDGTITLPKIDTVVMVCYLAIILFVIIRFLYNYIIYRKGKAKIINMSKPVKPEDIGNDLEGRKAFKSVKIYTSDDFEPLSMGVISPIIVVPNNCENSSTNRNIISHELQHIKHKDFLLKVTAFVVVTIHWFNPLVYFMAREFNKLVEFYADECCVKNFSKEDMISYGYDVLNFASKKENNNNSFVSTFGNRDSVFLKERILEMKNSKKYNTFGKFFAISALAVSTICCSVVVFAYEDYPVMELAEGEYINSESDVIYEVVVDPEESIYKEEILPFTEETNVLMQVEGSDEYLPYTETEPRASCVHSYTNITIKEHIKNNTGGCTVKEYSARKCKNCNKTINKTLKNTHNYSVCPHS